MNQIALASLRFGNEGEYGCNYWHLPEYNALWLEWSGIVTTAEFIEINLKGVDLMVELGTTAWLSDGRNIGPIAPEANEWVQQVCFPLVVSKTKIKKLAIVMPKDVFGHLSATEVTDNLGQQLEDNPVFQLKNFGSLDDALAWIKA